MSPSKLIAFFGLHKNVSVILTAVLFIELGQRLAERFLPIYIMAIGGGAVVIGLSNGLNNLLGALYAFPGGYLSDRVGYKKSLVIFNIISMSGYLIIILFPYWQAAIAGAVLFTSWSAVSLPAVMSAISKLLPPAKQTMGVSMHSLIRRIPMALGPVLGGLCIAYWGEKDGIRAAFFCAFLVTLVSIFFQHILLDNPPRPTTTPATLHPLKLFREMKPDLKHLLVSDILIRFCEQIPYAFVVIWCMKVIGVSAVEFGSLTTIEMITAVLVYIPVAYLVEKKGAKKPFIAITFGFFSLFPLVLLFSKSMLALAFAFFIRGLKEFGEPTRKSLILDYAKGDHAGTLYGAYYMIRDVVVSAAAFLGGFLWLASPQANFIAAAVFGVIGTLYFLRFCKE